MDDRALAECFEKQECPQCGAKIASFEEGLSIGWRCGKCNWSVATTNTRHWSFDIKTRYDLWVDAAAGEERKKAIAKTAATLGADLKWTRGELDAGNPVVRGVSLTEAAAQ